MSADNELSSILSRRQQINEALENGEDVKPKQKINNIYAEFSRKQIKEYQTLFSRLANWSDIYLEHMATFRADKVIYDEPPVS